MKRARVSNIRATVLRIFGLALCVLPPVAAILAYFPLWQSESPLKLLSGATVLLLALAARPLIRLVGERLRTAATWGVWLLTFLLFLALEEIAGEMVVISFVGLVGNIVGGACLYFADRRVGDGE